MNIHRRACVTRFLAVSLIAALSCASAADTPAEVSGQRIFYTGHSFHMFVPAMIEEMVKTTDIQGHKLAGKQGIGGSRVIQHWELADDKNLAKKALIGGEVDVFTMAAHLQIPDEGITNFVNLGLEHNPNMRFLVQCSWYPFDVAAPAPGQPDLRIKDNSKRDDAKVADLQATLDGWRTQLEAQAADLNQKHGKKCVFIVPVGDAVVKLRAMVVAGEFPGITKQSALFRDPIGHGQGQIMALAAYCNFAALYRISPVGHTAPERSITPEQHAILQKIAWDTVSNYPPAGMK
jgi:opacity protein-like surface antigen